LLNHGANINALDAVAGSVCQAGEQTVADSRESERQMWGLGWGRVSEADVAAIAHEGEGVLLLGRWHGCCVWFGLKCRQVEIEDEEQPKKRESSTP